MVHDPCRRGYYHDELSRFHCEAILYREALFPPAASLHLRGMGLTQLYATQYWALLRDVDLSGNAFKSMIGLHHLRNARRLVLDDNPTLPAGDLAQLRSK